MSIQQEALDALADTGLGDDDPSQAFVQGYIQGASRGQDDDVLLTPREAADSLRVSLRTLGKWRREGKGPAGVRLGYNKIVYSKSVLQAWLMRKSELV